ncbi:CHRD domain-containing protein [Actinospica sp. MGRD01-02]|uniref:CHRD domain-containing protein n=1 Tax=Actinospica acidithermotolerans TaxID=2828514 RepID=A0A941E5V8_9ACTN|nr:CHRD domain-containing protein [Actinospica acidithermotolerans]MBR7826910.1 CHRD domain-containing protein [Actinospica acidithermotolerans]
MKKLVIGAAAAIAAGTVAGCGAHAYTASVVNQANAQGRQNGTTASAAASTQPVGYTYTTVDDPADPTFNQLLGINRNGIIAGYFGSGAAGHPNKGYRVSDHELSDFVNENFPGSVQTQVTGVNDADVTVGFWSATNNADNTNGNTGFYRIDGSYHSVAYPTSNNASPAVNQLLGINDDGDAVGFYTDAAGANHGYIYSIHSHHFRTVTVSGQGAASVTAAGIDNNGDIAGFFTAASGAQDGFLLTDGGRQTVLAYPGATMTQALGVNDHGEVVGVYQTGSGNSAQTHGFTWTRAGSFHTVDDPNGVGATTVNGVNDNGDLVGFYTDAQGNTDGMLATPASTKKIVEHLSLNPMPTGTVTISRDSDGTIAAHVVATGLTPGSAHTVEIDTADGASAVRLGSFTADGTGDANTTLTSDSPAGEVSSGDRFVLRLGLTGSDANDNALAREPIAQTGHLSDGYGTYELHAVDVDVNGTAQGQLSGNATVVYDPTAKTLSVTVNASGLTPGMHAAHIHQGSCRSQGSVLYMLMDYQADEHGNVVDETRTLSGVNQPPAEGTWYLNLHLGDSNSILSNGSPTLSFRPLLCANG